MPFLTFCIFFTTSVTWNISGAIGRDSMKWVDIVGRCCLLYDPLTSLPFLPAKNDYRAVREQLHAESECVIWCGFRRDQLNLLAGSMRGILRERVSEHSSSCSLHRALLHRQFFVIVGIAGFIIEVSDRSLSG